MWKKDKVWIFSMAVFWSIPSFKETLYHKNIGTFQTDNILQKYRLVPVFYKIDGRKFLRQIRIQLHKSGLCTMVAGGNPLLTKRGKNISHHVQNLPKGICDLLWFVKFSASVLSRNLTQHITLRASFLLWSMMVVALRYYLRYYPVTGISVVGWLMVGNTAVLRLLYHPNYNVPLMDS